MGVENIQIITIISFLGLTAISAAVILVIRELTVSPSAAGSMRVSRSLGRRQPAIFDQEPATGFAGRIDQAFDWLVLESGYDATPMGVFLLLIAGGLLLGGSIFVYYDNPALGAAGMIAGMTGMLVFLNIRRNRRMRAIRESFPSAIDLMARAVRAGESVDQSIELLSEETGGPLGEELRYTHRQIAMGLDVTVAMQNMARRMRLTELRMLATTLMVHRKSGGNLPDALDRLSRLVQDRISADRQMRATTGAGRSAAILIGIIAPVLYLIVFIFMPDHVRPLIEDPFGNVLLAIAFLLEIIGIIWIVRLLKTDD